MRRQQKQTASTLPSSDVMQGFIFNYAVFMFASNGHVPRLCVCDTRASNHQGIQYTWLSIVLQSYAGARESGGSCLSQRSPRATRWDMAMVRATMSAASVMHDLKPRTSQVHISKNMVLALHNLCYLSYCKLSYRHVLTQRMARTLLPQWFELSELLLIVCVA